MAEDAKKAVTLFAICDTFSWPYVLYFVLEKIFVTKKRNIVTLFF